MARSGALKSDYLSFFLFFSPRCLYMVTQTVKNPPAMQETWVQSPGWEDPLEEGIGNPLPYSCLENPHEQRCLVGCSPWGRKESDTTEWLSTYISLLLTGNFHVFWASSSTCEVGRFPLFILMRYSIFVFLSTSQQERDCRGIHAPCLKLVAVINGGKIESILKYFLLDRCAHWN